ncbi:hypothetical protein M218_17225 [Burkholderia pseudomallei MSHR338]|nr:hypothetical protein GBP346_A3822 [Burkholderia pseudomallei MSHR346]EDU08022.1 hypothetical protein BURPS1655_E0141 [Burkholderia pseudomallei 1655]EQA87856.1 hypothetical protein M218_17225 [Burkholderia pseudomallei MSHR338]
MKKQTTIWHGLSQYTFNSRHAASQHVKNVVEPLAVLLSQVLDDIR